MNAATDALLAANEDRWRWVDDVLVLDGPVLDPDSLTVEDIDPAYAEIRADVLENVKAGLIRHVDAQIHDDLVEAGLAMPDPDPCPPGSWAITDSQDEWPDNWLA